MSCGLSIDPSLLVERIGEDGKDGKTFVVALPNKSEGKLADVVYKLKRGTKVAVKKFKTKKSIKMIQKEADFQQKAFLVSTSPQVYGIDLVQKCIYMKLLQTLPANTHQNESLPESLQYMICALMNRLDSILVLHGDMNALNVMLDAEGRPYLIDFGFAKRISAKVTREFGIHPNITVSLRGLSMGFSRHKVSVPIIDACVKAANANEELSFWFQEGERCLARFN